MEKAESIWLDGSLVPWDEANFHFFTHTFHYGLGVFEGIRAYRTADGRTAIFRLTEHIRRLFESARTCLIKIPLTPDEVMEGCRQVVAKNGLAECYLRPMASMGEGSMGIGATDNSIHVAVGAFPWGAYLGDDALEQGIRCCVSSLSRVSSRAGLTKAKICGQYVNSILAKRAAMMSGYDEAILLDDSGLIAEGSGENIFLIRDGVLVTPPASSPILPGITRDAVLRLARDRVETLKVEIRESSFSREELYAADELFFTGTAAEVTPIREVDGRQIGAGRPGPITRALADAYHTAVRGGTSTTKSGSHSFEERTVTIRLAADDIELRKERYHLLRVDPDVTHAVLKRLSTMSAPFQMVVKEEDALTLLIREQDRRELGDLLRGATEESSIYRLITFRPTLPWNLVGFMARVTALLAEHEIPLGAISSFDRDHLFIREDRAETALSRLRDAAREGRLP